MGPEQWSKHSCEYVVGFVGILFNSFCVGAQYYNDNDIGFQKNLV